jgi:dimethylargininase
MAFRYDYAIVSRIPDTFFANKPGINKEKCRQEHYNFVEVLREIGVDVLELEAEERHPDCVKVDDTAVVINGTALMCNPHGVQRQGEVNLIRQTLKKELGLKVVELQVDGASLEGSDVLFTGKEIIVGISAHTNEAGAQAVARAFPEYATTIVRLHGKFHNLKDCVTMAGANVLAVSQDENAQKILREIMSVATYTYRIVWLHEIQAAHTFYMNHVLVHLCDAMIPSSFGVFENKIDYNRIPIDLSELYRAGIALPKLALMVGKFRNQKNIVSTLP